MAGKSSDSPATAYRRLRLLAVAAESFRGASRSLHGSCAGCLETECAIIADTVAIGVDMGFSACLFGSVVSDTIVIADTVAIFVDYGSGHILTVDIRIESGPHLRSIADTIAIRIVERGMPDRRGGSIGCIVGKQSGSEREHRQTGNRENESKALHGEPPLAVCPLLFVVAFHFLGINKATVVPKYFHHS